MTDKERYDKARIAIRDAKDGNAYLELGILYAKGIGTNRNYVLASYFYEKALAFGCQEAEKYIEQEYKLGHRDIVGEVERAMENSDDVPPHVFSRLAKRVEKERLWKNFGYLFRIREYLPKFYPEYNRDKAINDILGNRSTIDTEIMYAMSSSNIRAEVHIDLQEKLLAQLFAPIIQDEELYRRIIAANDLSVLVNDEKELIECVKNLASSYAKLCDNHNIEKLELTELKPEDTFPFIKVSLLPRLRWQTLRCLLSVKDVSPLIRDEFLISLDNDDDLLDICERENDENIELFLISFVELNIDMEAIEQTNLNLLNAYWNNKTNILALHLNEGINRLNQANIPNSLCPYDSTTLPPIQL